MKRYKILISIVVSFFLTTIVACSSVKKTKVQESEKFAVKEEVNTSTSLEETTSKEISIFANTNIKRDNLQIEYLPEFDAEGKLIPFSFHKKDSNGNQTNVSITGNAKVKYFTEHEVSNIVQATKEENAKRLTVMENRILELESKLDKQSKIKQVYPDYIKYIIWLGIGFLLLTGIIITLYFYIKSKLKILP